MIVARSQVGGAWIYSSKPPGECKIEYDAYGRPFPLHAEEELSNGKQDVKHTAANGATGTPCSSHTVDLAVLDPSPMYRLRTNIPSDLMSYRGFPFKEASGPFP